ncbi:MAG TPA: NHL repeat-containing protein [Pyrinomonadaceae bacterium]|nr:NHL repeat-containing protein [Pyrinomonadaceae bacterium]
MQTFDCPKCGAPVNYDPAIASTARCGYCSSQLAVPNPYLNQGPRVIKLDIGPGVASGAKKIASLALIIPILIIVFVFVIILVVFGMVTSTIRSVTAPLRTPTATRSGPSGARTGDAANAFARVALQFGEEGIGPGMFTDARSIGVDSNGNIYVGEYSGGRIQVFDSAGKFIRQWTTVDPKMPLRGMTVDRKGTVYVAQRGIITRYDGETGESIGTVKYSEGDGFDDVTMAPDGGLVCAWYRGRDDIVRFNAQGSVVRTIRAAVSTAADRSELNTRVAIDGRGNIYALGTFANGVFKFSPEGKFTNRFGSQGSQPGQISAADAVAVDGKGRVYISDIKGIQVFDSEGRYLTSFRPEGVAFGMVFNDRNELLVVARNKVVKFSINQ